MSFTHSSANEQWRMRPADQRYTSLTDLQAATQHVMDHSNSRVVASKALVADVKDNQLVVRGPSGNAAIPTHWAFGQLAQRAGAPAGYLRDLPNELAADCINYGLHFTRPVEDIGVLLYQNGGPAEIHAITGPNYGRVWNARVAQALVEAFGDGRTGTWRVPGEFADRSVAITRENTTLYASDRDMWAFLADESKAVPIHDRRDGMDGVLSTGIVVGNSDVGAGKLWVAYFAYDYVCCNRMIWGMQDLEEFSIRHTASAPHRFMREVVPMLQEVARSTMTLSEARIVAAQNARIEDFDKFMASRKFNRSQISGMKAAYKTDEGQPLPQDSDGITSTSVWSAVVAATAYARTLQYQDARIDIERVAGKMLQEVAA